MERNLRQVMVGTPEITSRTISNKRCTYPRSRKISPVQPENQITGDLRIWRSRKTVEATSGIGERW